jgi:hypothetical protein
MDLEKVGYENVHWIQLNRDIQVIKKTFWEEVIACFSLTRHEPHRKRLLQ